MPDLHGVRTVGNVSNSIRSVRLRDGEVRSRDGDDEGFHLRVHFAEQSRDALLLERVALRLPLRPRSEIELVRAGVGRKDVVKNGVGIEEIDGRSDAVSYNHL